jgi:hypothetical protein
LPKYFTQLPVVDLIGEGLDHGVDVQLQAVAGELNAIREALLQVGDYLSCRNRITLA